MHIGDGDGCGGSNFFHDIDPIKLMSMQKIIFVGDGNKSVLVMLMFCKRRARGTCDGTVQKQFQREYAKDTLSARWR